MSGIVRPNNTGQSGIVANVETIDSDDYIDGSIDNAHLADDAVDSDELAAGAVDTAHIGNLQVTTAKIAGDAINGTKLADDAVDSEHYTDGSIDTAHIADNAVTLAKMDGITRGSIIIGDSNGDPAALGIGSNTYVLTSDATDISWAAAGSGASLSGSTNNTVATVTGANALIGETNLTFDGSLLTVTGTVNVENAAAGIVMRFKDTDSTGTAVNQYFVFQGSDDAVVGYIGKTSTGQMYLFNESSTNTILGAGGLTRLTIASNGTFTGSASNDISDSRIKENIEDTPVGLAEIMRLRPVRYNFQAGKGWGEPDQKFYGLLAQEVEGVIPEAVHTEIIDIDEVVAGKKHDVNGITDLKSVSMSQITAALIKAVQELKAEIEELKA
jgi:hypothetical protein